MTLGSTGAFGRMPGPVRQLKSSADDDDSSAGGPDEPEFAGRSATLRSWPFSLGVGLRGASEPADLAGDRAPSTRFLRYEFQ
jgi:hypothetical protein